MSITTRTPRANVLSILPELEGRETKTVRLHPRHGSVSNPTASKIGGQFLWPADEPWPCCRCPELEEGVDDEDDWPESNVEVPYIRLLQLHSDEFPEMEFYPGTNTFQMLCCPVRFAEGFPPLAPRVYWRNSADLGEVMKSQPELDDLADYWGIADVNECQLHPERICEYPAFVDLSPSLKRKLTMWGKKQQARELFDDIIENAANLYEHELSVASGSKIGGFVHWLGKRANPICDCGKEMDFLLTLACHEFVRETWRRWAPEDLGDVWEMEGNERRYAMCAAFDDCFTGAYHLFVCRTCDDWPVQAVHEA